MYVIYIITYNVWCHIIHTYPFINVCFPYYFLMVSRGEGLQNYLRALGHQRVHLIYTGQLSFCISKHLPHHHFFFSGESEGDVSKKECLHVMGFLLDAFAFISSRVPSVSVCPVDSRLCPQLHPATLLTCFLGGNGICVYVVLQPQFACCGEWDKEPQPWLVPASRFLPSRKSWSAVSWVVAHVFLEIFLLCRSFYLLTAVALVWACICICYFCSVSSVVLIEAILWFHWK